MPKEKSCKNCALCERVYTKCAYGMYACDEYLCKITKDFTEEKSACGRWRERAEEYDLSAERFDRAEEDITAVMQIFEEKKIPLSTFPSKKRITRA